MLNPRHFLRMAKWARRPPPAWKIKLVAAILAAGLIIAGVERFIGWPDMLTLERPPRSVLK